MPALSSLVQQKERQQGRHLAAICAIGRSDCVDEITLFKEQDRGDAVQRCYKKRVRLEASLLRKALKRCLTISVCHGESIAAAGPRRLARNSVIDYALLLRRIFRKPIAPMARRAMLPGSGTNVGTISPFRVS